METRMWVKLLSAQFASLITNLSSCPRLESKGTRITSRCHNPLWHLQPEGMRLPCAPTFEALRCSTQRVFLSIGGGGWGVGAMLPNRDSLSLRVSNNRARLPLRQQARRAGHVLGDPDCTLVPVPRQSMLWGAPWCRSDYSQVAAPPTVGPECATPLCAQDGRTDVCREQHEWHPAFCCGDTTLHGE